MLLEDEFHSVHLTAHPDPRALGSADVLLVSLQEDIPVLHFQQVLEFEQQHDDMASRDSGQFDRQLEYCLGRELVQKRASEPVFFLLSVCDCAYESFGDLIQEFVGAS